VEAAKVAGAKLVKAAKSKVDKAAAEKKMKAALEKLGNSAAQAKLKETADADKKKADEALATTKELATTAKKEAVSAGADARLFELIPDDVDGTVPDEIDLMPQNNGAMYYAGLASVSLVSFAVAMIAFRKISLTRRTLTGSHLPVDVEDGMMTEECVE